MVVAGVLVRKDAFAVLEDGAVLGEGEGAARLDQVERVVRLGRQCAVADVADGGRRRGRGDRGGAADEEGGCEGDQGADASGAWGNLMTPSMTRVDSGMSMSRPTISPGKSHDFSGS